jgi:4-amino-4-deoxy-L-arabinose transferase-like glycosyltransferase
MTPQRALWIIVIVTGVLRLGLAAGLGLGNDEAYYYLFTVHPDWSFYDHPPMVALVQAIGLVASRGAVSPFSVRVGFVLLFVGSTWLMASLARRLDGPWAGAYAAFLFNVALYFGAAVGTFALPDGPLVFFWLLTLDRLVAALNAPDRLGPWIWVGLAWGGAMLSKYHAMFVPLGTALFLVLEPSARFWLRRSGPYVALASGLVLFAPVIAWNAAHDWASFAFQGGRAVGEMSFRPAGFLAALVGQAIYLTPWIWALLAGTIATAIWRRRQIGATHRLLVCQTAFPLVVFGAVACVRPVLPHWSLIGYLPLVPMLGARWVTWSHADQPRNRRRLAVLALLPVLIAAGLLAQVRGGVTLGGLAESRDPSADLYGWPEVAAELSRRGLADRPRTFLFTSKWYYSAQLAFALGERRCPVLCYSSTDARGFGQWSSPGRWLGHDGILLVVNHSSTEPAAFDRWFERIEPLGQFDVLRSGAPVRTVRLYRCVSQTQPFPFDGSGKRRPHGARLAARAALGDNCP